MTGIAKITVPPRRFWFCFLATRLLEAICLVVSFSIESFFEGTVDPLTTSPFAYWTPSTLGQFWGIIVATYYVAFGYIAVSFFASVAAWRYWQSLSARRYRLLNLTVFTFHSLAVLLLAGTAGLGLWCIWAAMVSYNATMPYVFWRIFLADTETSRETLRR